VGVALGVWGFTPSHFLTFPGVCDVTPGLPLALGLGLLFALAPGLPFGLTPGLPFGPHPCNSLCLGREPKARVATTTCYGLLANVGTSKWNNKGFHH